MTTVATTISPIENFLPLLKGHRVYSRGYTAKCPAHADSEDSLMIWEDPDGHVGLKCFANCQRAAICQALGITESDLYASDGKTRPKRAVIDVCDLAVDKGIHPRDLEYLGLKDGEHTFPGKTHPTKGVIIPYYDLSGKEYERFRLRTALKAKDGSFWCGSSGNPLIPYGLNRLSDAKKASYLIIVEGESDCWTLWGHQYPALGIPGTSNEKALKAEHITDIKTVYILQEPGEAGDKFPATVYKRLQSIGYMGKAFALNLAEDAGGAKDPNDLHKRSVADFKTSLDAAMKKARPLHSVRPKPDIRLLRDLQQEMLPATKWAIPDILPEGLTLLCGKPKMGKSWLALALQNAVAAGGVALGSVPVESGEVLYISLEDNKKRLKSRINTQMQNQLVSENFHYITQWARMDQGGLTDLEEWIQEHPNVRIICIDTWAKIKPKGHGKQQYDEDYDALAPLQELAARHSIAILIVHHFRKMESSDPIDMISGSSAMAGAVDGFLLLYRKRGEDDARLYVTGRDIEEEQEYVMTFNRECATWVIKGDADSSEVATTPERQRILDVLKQGELSVKELASKLGKNVNTTRNHLVPLRNEGKVILENNVYRLVTLVTTSKASNTSQTSNPLEHTALVTSQATQVTSPEPLTSNPLVTPLEAHEKPDEEEKKEPLTSLTSLTSQISQTTIDYPVMPLPTTYNVGQFVNTPDRGVGRVIEVNSLRTTVEIFGQRHDYTGLLRDQIRPCRR